MAPPAPSFIFSSAFTRAPIRTSHAPSISARAPRRVSVSPACPTMVVKPDADTGKVHNTADYPTTLFTVRRGQPFDLAAESTTLTVTPVSAAPNKRGRSIGPAVTLQAGGGSNGWTLAQAGDKLRLTIPPDASVGLYSLDDGVGSAFELAVVFNPFVEADSVYMSDAAERDEYVLNESGLIWRGSSTSSYPAAWDFAQFDEKIVLASLFMIELLDYEERADPVAVTRHLSAVVNSNDDGGVLVGRWDGKYDDGVPPTQWTGSGKIIRQFYDTVRPVKYGQCWVFAGLLTTVCRALGIPTRVTTNFSSAHDTTRPYNRAVDMYFDREGDVIERMTSDSIWNFHVWCDAWMKRPDLAGAAQQTGVDMDGWQAIDATPQELSDGVFKMGPSPLDAIKNGYAVEYDTDFVIGEVNADVLYYWQKDDSDEFVVQNKRTRSVGKYTSTKEVGSDERNDVTNMYKYPEGSAAERNALANNVKPSDAIEPEPNQPTDLAFDQQFDPRVPFGDDIRVVLTAKNNGAAAATVRFASLARAIRYTGEPTSRIEKKVEEVTIAPGETAQMALTLTEAEYQPALVRDVQTIKFINSAKIGATGQTWADECIVRVYGDKALGVSAPAALGLFESAEASVTVTNSFRVPLTNVVVNAEGRGLAEPTTLTLGTIEPGAKKTASVPIFGAVPGVRRLVFTLDTEELQDIIKSTTVVVGEAGGSSSPSSPSEPDSSGFFSGLFSALRNIFG